MQKYFSQLVKSPLFIGITEMDMPILLNCLGARLKQFDKGDYIFTAGRKVSDVGIVLTGRVQISKDDIMGNRAILTDLGPLEIFGEAFAAANIDHAPVNVQSVVNSNILFIDIKRIITICPASCKFHSKLLDNLLKVIATKNIMLNQKIEIVSQRTTREKLLSYLYNQAQKYGALTFEISFNRQDLADYLGVDRSAMSREMGHLRDEGLLKYEGNLFELLNR